MAPRVTESVFSAWSRSAAGLLLPLRTHTQQATWLPIHYYQFCSVPGTVILSLSMPFYFSQLIYIFSIIAECLEEKE